ncbi:MAG: hypothetical protein NVSMB68_05780 [Thermoanaerobaculia bacterium]
MGVALWILCGAAAFTASRAVRLARPRGFALELILAILVAFLAGLAATALDFGGWNEVDWRAGAFVFLCTLAAVGISRSIGLSTRRIVEH